MGEDWVFFRGRLVPPDWPDQLRDSQLRTTCRPNGIEVPRVPYGDEAEDWGASDGPCPDCAAIQGELHARGCDVERCPACGGQLWFGCECEWPEGK